TTACTTTSRPDPSIPAASQPRTIGRRSAEIPTPRRVQMSWWFSEAARTVTISQPSGADGSGRSPSPSPPSGSSASMRVAVTANMTRTLAARAAGPGAPAEGGARNAWRAPLQTRSGPISPRPEILTQPSSTGTLGRLCHTQGRRLPPQPRIASLLGTKGTRVDLTGYADLAVRLVNSAAPGGDRDGLASVEAYRTLVADRPHLCGQVMPVDLETLRLLREELRLIFAAAAARQDTEVAERLNALLARYPVHPHIVRHDGQPWHLHLVDSGSVADRHAAGAAFGLAGLVTESGTDRLRSCPGPGCQRVFIGNGPPRDRRYCSEACASRANVRAFHSRGGGQRPAATSAGRGPTRPPRRPPQAPPNPRYREPAAR